MKKIFNITPRAKSDIHAIWIYTLEIWGEVQADKYIADLFARFEWLTERYAVGKHRPEIHNGYYSYPQGDHVIFYLIRNDVITIIGIPHKNMDILGYFE